MMVVRIVKIVAPEKIKEKNGGRLGVDKGKSKDKCVYYVIIGHDGCPNFILRNNFVGMSLFPTQQQAQPHHPGNVLNNHRPMMTPHTQPHQDLYIPHYTPQNTPSYTTYINRAKFFYLFDTRQPILTSRQPT